MQQVVKRSDAMTASEQKLLASQKLVLERVFNEIEGTEGATDIIVRIFRACSPDALGLVTRRSFGDYMGRRYGIERLVCDELFTLADPTGRGEADAQQFRHVFLLLDRHGFHQDQPYRRQLRRYEPEKDATRPTWWQDSQASFQEQKRESLQRFEGSNVPLSKLHESDRALFRDCHMLSGLIETQSKQVERAFVRDRVARGSHHHSTKLTVEEVKEVLSSFKVDVSVDSLRTLFRDASKLVPHVANAETFLTYSQLVNATRARLQSQRDAAGSSEQTQMKQWHRGHHVGCRAQQHGHAAGKPMLAPGQGGSHADMLSHNMMPNGPGNTVLPELCTKHSVVRLRHPQNGAPTDMSPPTPTSASGTSITTSGSPNNGSAAGSQRGPSTTVQRRWSSVRQVIFPP